MSEDSARNLPPAVFQELGPEGLRPAPGKSCGSCTSCCFTVAVAEINLPSFTRCPHLRPPFAREIGCSIYPNRPSSCRKWSCTWLIGDLPEEYRPDRCGVVIDPLPDIILINGKETPAAQFYALRGFEEAWREGPARTLIEQVCQQQQIPVLWRQPPNQEGVCLARAFTLEEKGGIGYSALFPSESQKIGSERDRLIRAQQILQNRGDP